MFHSSVLSCEIQSLAFYTYMTKFRNTLKRAEPTETHHFLRALCVAGILVGEYTQNIDGMSERAGLQTGVNAILNNELGKEEKDHQKTRDPVVHCVLLYGCCVICDVRSAPEDTAGTRTAARQRPWPAVHLTVQAALKHTP